MLDTQIEKPITEEQANLCLAAVKLHFADRIADAGEAPKLYPPGFHDSGWTIAWEGMWEWTLFTLHDDRLPAWPSDVMPEPVNGWCLGLYRDLWS